MSRVFFVFIFAAIFLSGCAAGIKREVYGLRMDVASSREEIQKRESLIDNAKTSLKKSDAFDGKQCLTLSRGQEPKLSCHTQQQAKDKALVSCTIEHYATCDTVVQLFSDKLDDPSEKFLKSQACEIALAESQGKPYNPSAAGLIVSGMTIVAEDKCKNGGFFGKFFGCVTVAAKKLSEYEAFASCVAQQSSLCFSNYQNWKDRPVREKTECESNLATISRETDNNATAYRRLRQQKEWLSAKESSFMWKLFGKN